MCDEYRACRTLQNYHHVHDDIHMYMYVPRHPLYTGRAVCFIHAQGPTLLLKTLDMQILTGRYHTSYTAGTSPLHLRVAG